MLAWGMAVGRRRNGVYGGWTHAGNSRVYVRVPSELKERSESSNGANGFGPVPELDSTPIVLVHGFTSSRTLKPLIRALGSRRPVFAPDLPGFGMSDQPIHPLDVPRSRRCAVALAVRQPTRSRDRARGLLRLPGRGGSGGASPRDRGPAGAGRPHLRSKGAQHGAAGAPLGAQRPAFVAPARPDDRARLHRRRPVAKRVDLAARARGSGRGEALGDRGADAGRPPGARPPRPRGVDGSGGGADSRCRARRAAEGGALGRSGDGDRLTALLVPFLAERRGRGRNRRTPETAIEPAPR